MRILLTGGCGFVGTNLASDLVREGHDVWVFDNLSRSGSALNLDWLRSLGNVRFVRGDVRIADDVVQAIREISPETIYHLAGQVAMTTSIRDPRNDFEINVLGSINLLEAVRLHAPEATVVYASTNKVYGDLANLPLIEDVTRYREATPTDGIDEYALLSFQSPYGCSKGAADQYMLDYARIYGLKTVVFRHSTIYGGRQFATFDQGWIGWFCRQALEIRNDNARAPFTIAGNGKQVRDLLHVSDAVHCYRAAVRNIEAARGEAFNIGGGMQNSMSLLELFAHLESVLGITMKYDRLPERESDQRFFVADSAKARRFLDWQPLVSKERGIESVLDWEVAARIA